MVYTDNNPLTYVHTTAKLGATEMRWVAELAQFDFTFEYKSGRTNQNADALSRKAEHGQEPTTVSFEGIFTKMLGDHYRPTGTPVLRELTGKLKDNATAVWIEEVQTQSSKSVPCCISTLPALP